MSADRKGNLVHSVQERLRNKARQEGRLYEELLVRHALERFLHRLAKTVHREDFILKGALLLPVWTGLEARPTRDIDLLGPIGLEPVALRAMIDDCLAAEVSADGWTFVDKQGVSVRPIREGAAYMGQRAVFSAHLGRSRVRMQLDVGTGDEVVPSPTRVLLPTLLDQEAPDLLCYSPYTSIAEKLDAMIVLGVSNSRMKDFFDIAFLAGRMEFDGDRLRDSIASCCRHRRTALNPELPAGLHADFANDETARLRWDAFAMKPGMEVHAMTWAPTVAACRAFLAAPLNAAATGREFNEHWRAGGPWTGELA